MAFIVIISQGLSPVEAINDKAFSVSDHRILCIKYDRQTYFHKI